MDQAEAIELLKSEKEIVALEPKSYALFLALGLALLHQGVYPIAKVVKGFPLADALDTAGSKAQN